MVRMSTVFDIQEYKNVSMAIGNSLTNITTVTNISPLHYNFSAVTSFSRLNARLYLLQGIK